MSFGSRGSVEITVQQRQIWRAYIDGSSLLSFSLATDLELSAGLSMSEYEILVRLAEAKNGTLRMSVLAEQLSHSRSRISHTVKRIERIGLVERGKSTSDRRGIDCIITPAGLRKLQLVEPQHMENVRSRFIDLMTDEELIQLGAIFRKLNSRAHALAERESAF